MPRKIHCPRHAVDTPAPVRLTRWNVITGAPCSGKTSVIADLARRGWGVVPEAARAHIDAELRKGRPLLAIKSDPRRFESLIFKAKLRIEARLPADEPLFLDRALPDSIAYYLLEGLDSVPARISVRAPRLRQGFGSLGGSPDSRQDRTPDRSGLPRTGLRHRSRSGPADPRAHRIHPRPPAGGRLI
jgi:hypothetical protein